MRHMEKEKIEGLTKTEQLIVQSARLDALEHCLEMMKDIDSLEKLELFKLSLAVVLEVSREAKTQEEATANLEKMLGIKL